VKDLISRQRKNPSHLTTFPKLKKTTIKLQIVAEKGRPFPARERDPRRPLTHEQLQRPTMLEARIDDGRAQVGMALAPKGDLSFYLHPARSP